jgi:outer membrane protein TolC
LKGSSVRSALFSLLLPLSLLATGDGEILSGEKQLQLKLKAEKNREDASKLQDSWINPLTLSATQSTSNVDTTYESESMTYRLSLSQDIFRSGGIYYAIKYADATEKLQNTILRLEKQSLKATAYQLLLQLKKTRLTIEKQKLAIQNAEIDVKYKQEQYLNGLTDISFLSNAILTKNQLKNSLAEMESTKGDLIRQFSDISDLEPEAVEAIRLDPISRDEYVNRNLTIAQKQNEIESKRYVKNMTVASYLPKLTFDASYVQEDSETNFGAFAQEKEEGYYNYSFKLTIPLNINTFRDIESSRLDYLISRSELDTQKRQEQNYFQSIQKNLDAIAVKEKLAREDAELYGKLLLQTKEQLQAGYKTKDDVTVMANSKRSSELDIAIYKLDRQLELLKLYAKMEP